MYFWGIFLSQKYYTSKILGYLHLTPGFFQNKSEKYKYKFEFMYIGQTYEVKRNY